MPKSALEFTILLQRIASLPYNHYFEEEIVRIRQKHKIPKGLKNTDYHFRDSSLECNKNKQTIPHRSIFLPIEGNGILTIELPERAVTREAINYINDSKPSLDRDIRNLLFQFQLPYNMFDNVLSYLFTNNT